jgi:hypothetical protein
MWEDSQKMQNSTEKKKHTFCAIPLVSAGELGCKYFSLSLLPVTEDVV